MDNKRLKQLKVRLKLWEKEFYTKNGVKPTKHDIHSNDIKILYKEYQSLTSKEHVGASKSHIGTSSKNSVFGAYLNKEKLLREKKPVLCSASSKTLGWSKHHGWEKFQSIPNDSKAPKSECSEVNEEDIFESLLSDDSSFKICENSQRSYHTDTVNIVTTRKNLKFGNSVTPKWMTNNQLSIINVSKEDGITENEAVADSQDKTDTSLDCSVEPMSSQDKTDTSLDSSVEPVEYSQHNQDKSGPDDLLIRPVTVKTKSSVSENYIRLNLKRAHYSRGRVNRTGSYYKRQKWKKRKSSACFKCGQMGHWAKSCTQTKRDDTDAKVDVPCTSDKLTKVTMANGLVTEAEMSSPGLSSVTVTTHEVVQPLYNYQETESFSVTTEVLDTLKTLGYESFRMKQEECIMRILSGISTLVVLPTGVGKSLCYQLPAYLYHIQRCHSITLLVSPLISLIDNQMKNLPECLKAVAIHSGQSKSERTKAVKSIKSGNIAIVMTTPEMIIESASHINSFLYSLPPVAFICLDEVHCIAEWSHNFRPSYLRICKVLHTTLNVTCFLGLTATATQQTIGCIQCSLDIMDKNCLQDYSVPSNLILSVSCVQHKEKALVELLQSHDFNSLSSVMIYCNRQQTTERIAQYLRTRLQASSAYKSKTSSVADCYHAGLSTAQRKQVQASFMSGQLNIVVATIAFGMGINKQDVRVVIHYDLPNSFEAYVQEIGRAGRDGLDAFCHTFISFQNSDLNELKKHIYANSMDRYMIKHLVSSVFSVICDCSRNESIEKLVLHII